LTDAEATIKTELLSVCRAKPGLDSPYVSPEQVCESVLTLPCAAVMLTELYPTQVAQIGQYFARTLLSHYRLYQHCFTKDQDVTEYTDTLLVGNALMGFMGLGFTWLFTCLDPWHAHLFELRSLSCQIETPIIPPFDSAIPESDWRAQLEQARLDKESAEHAELAAKAAAAEAAEQERLEQQKADELAARQAELENVGAFCCCML